MPELILLVRERVKKYALTAGYGHIGDGNMHLNVPMIYDVKNIDKCKDLIEPFIFDYVRDKNGSISAEHGLGLNKSKYLHYAKSPEVISYMKQIKEIFDPNYILNPYKIFP